ncbi:hypothetical protein FJZ19_01120 [Candidatus Pacearchaeota archaeon]|nr:hypothetical protein [Candidatus Pacearchaeota archaeon]
MTNITEEAKRLMDEYQADRKISAKGKPLFIAVCGSHYFGYPSAKSDIDVRGVYLAPTENLLRLRKKVKEPTISQRKGNLDLEIDELGHFLSLVAHSNGSRFEWVNSPLLISASDEYQNLQNLVNTAGVSRRLINYYLNFSRNQQHKPIETTKRDFHTIRGYLTGIALAETGRLVFDMRELSTMFDYDEAKKIAESKQTGKPQAENQEKLAELIRNLDARLVAGIEKSGLPETPDIQKINNFLVRIRQAS